MSFVRSFEFLKYLGGFRYLDVKYVLIIPEHQTSDFCDISQLSITCFWVMIFYAFVVTLRYFD